MARFGAFTVRTECGQCGQPVPLNGPFRAVHCNACQADAAVPDGLWNTLLGKLDDEHDAMPEGAATRQTSTLDGNAYHWSLSRCLPRCDKCSATLPLDVPPGDERDVFCTGCGDGASVYPAPPWLRAMVPTAQQVTSVDRGAGADARRAVPVGGVVEAAQPVVMPCPQCGGALQLAGDTERVVKCRFCAADVYLPDDLWRRLHPVRVVREWFVRFEGETRANRARRASQQAAAARQQAEDEARAHREAEAEEDASLLDAQIDRLLRSACVGVLVACLLLLAAIGWNVGTSQVFEVGDARQPVGIALLVVALIGVIVAIVLAGRPIQRRTGFDGQFMFFQQWFFLIFALVMPVAGQVMALVIGVMGIFRGQVGGSTITSNGSSTSYPVKDLPRGEGRPLGLVYLAMAFLYPGVVATLFGLS